MDRIPFRVAVVLTAAVVLTNIPCRIGLAASVGDVSSFSWLAGLWQADTPAGQFQDMFQPAANGEMLCTLQVALQGRIVRYELCAIRKQGANFVFQVAAFGADLRPESPVPVRPLLAATGNSLKFDGIEFIQTGPDSMTVTVNIVAPDSSAKPLELHYSRTSRFVRRLCDPGPR
jgi:hypothetical protein